MTHKYAGAERIPTMEEHLARIRRMDAKVEVEHARPA